MNDFLERYKQLGEEFIPENVKQKPAIRVNTLKIKDAELMERLNAKLTKISFLQHGYYYESEFSMGATPEYLQGYCYLQEAASQLPAEILDPGENDLVLDMCAAPGSKTTQLAMMMNNKGKIIALDANNPRLPSLQNNLERCGVMNTIVYKKDARYAEDLKLVFDKILLDAPCSGNFANDKEWLEERKVEDLKLISKTQKQILETAFHILKPNGIIVYSTCSLEPEEDELVINDFLEKNPTAALEKISARIGDNGLTNVFGKELNPEIAKCKRLWPHKTGTQGFFLAKIRKK
ncbi:RsmB/NOP family class I SAM-dependent RNA methyltransferase [Candidatus Woesearchaeota archaeon]|nr:RsmB/NOP family class I SAM-dependent RNA methyltransferase [Candidatus Woesearchaeota archaeon]